MKDSKIAWTHHTFNPWWGCEKVSAACKNCYAESFARRVGQNVWGGADTQRRFFGDKHWNEPLKWDREAAAAGERHRVFCASMADILEKRPDLEAPRARVFELAEHTPNLDWLFLTKRPENAPMMLPTAWFDAPPPNVWWGATVETQEMADLRVPLLLAIPAAIRFLSMEPLLENVMLHRWLARWWCPEHGELWQRTHHPLDHGRCDHPITKNEDYGRIDQVIVGFESGPKFRIGEIEWVRDLMWQCEAAGVARFVKQLGKEVLWNGISNPGQHWPTGTEMYDTGRGNWCVRLHDRKGDKLHEWPEDLRVQEIPQPRRAA